MKLGSRSTCFVKIKAHSISCQNIPLNDVLYLHAVLQIDSGKAEDCSKIHKEDNITIRYRKTDFLRIEMRAYINTPRL